MGRIKSIMQSAREGHSNSAITGDTSSWKDPDADPVAVTKIANNARKQQEGEKQSDTK